jgi:hypothetical protein
MRTTRDGGAGGPSEGSNGAGALPSTLGGHPPAPDDNDDDEDPDDAPSALLGPLLNQPDLLGLVLAGLDPTDCAQLARAVGPPSLATSGSPSLKNI